MRKPIISPDFLSLMWTENTFNWHTISRPCGREMVCLLKVFFSVFEDRRDSCILLHLSPLLALSLALSLWGHHQPAGMLTAMALDSFTVSLHSPNGMHLPAARAVQEDCQWPMNHGGTSHRSHEPTIHYDRGCPKLYFNQPITKECCQPIEANVSHPTDSPPATRLAPCNSLPQLHIVIAAPCRSVRRALHPLLWELHKPNL